MTRDGGERSSSKLVLNSLFTFLCCEEVLGIPAAFEWLLGSLMKLWNQFNLREKLKDFPTFIPLKTDRPQFRSWLKTFSEIINPSKD